MTLGLVVAAVLVVAGLAGGIVSSTDRLERRSAQARMHAAALLAADYVRAQTSGLTDVVAAYAGRQQLIDAFIEPPGPTRQAVLDAQVAALRAARPDVPFAFAADPRGRLLSASPPTPELVGQDFRYRDWYRGAVTTRRPYVSEAYRTAARGQPYLVAASDLVRSPADGRVVGMIVITWPLDALQQFVTSYAHREGIRLAVVDQRGTVLADGSRPVSPSASLAQRRAAARRLLGHPAGVVTATVGVPEIGWTVASQLPARAALAAADRQRAGVLGAAVLLVGLLIAGGVVRHRVVARRQADQRALRASEERFRLLAENSTDLISRHRLDGTITYCSPASATMLGYQPADLVGTRPWQLCHPDDADAAAEAWRAAPDATGVTALTARVRHRDGGWRWLETTVRRAHAGEGLPAELHSDTRDITGRKHAEDRFRGLLEAAPDAMVVTDDHGRIVLVNQQAERMFGYEQAELLGQPVEQLVPERHRGQHTAHVHGYVQAPRLRTLHGPDVHARRKDGSEVPIELSLAPLATEHGLLVSAAVRDISERRRAEQALREATERFTSAFHGAPIGVALVSLSPAAPGRYLQVNRALCNLLGYTTEQLLARSIHDDVHPDDLAEASATLAELVGPPAELPGRERRCVHADGHTVWVRVHSSTIRDHTSRPMYAVVHVEDVSDRHHAEQQLAHQAMHDPLTGLANRHLLVARLEHALDALDRAAGQAVGVLYLDLDGFKQVNDTLGHDAGDQFLAQVAHRLDHAVRRPDTVARIGGDEFAVVCGQIGDERDVLRVVERIKGAIGPPVSIGGTTFTPSASIGVVVTRSANDHPIDLLRAADDAMYHAKRRGGDRYELFDEQLRAAAAQRHDIEADLRHAIGDGWLRLHYQPIVELRDGRIVAAEALVRMQHPIRGLLDPGVFLDVAEASGLIVPIGEWVLGEACRQAATWQAGSATGLPLNINININLSGRQVLQDGLCARIAAAIDQAGIDPATLTLELTETIFTEANRSFLDEFELLKQRGVRLALDDFGTGYSSLAYLERFPVDEIKIDRGFIAALDAGSRAPAIISAIVALAQGLGLTVIAEGVETAEQHARLQELGCTLAQGFYFSRPRPAEQLTSLLAPGRGTALPTGN